MSKLYIHNKFGQAPNNLLNNDSVSFKAKGIFTFLQSKPNGWSFSVAGIKEQTKDGKTAIESGLKELEEAEYLKRKPKKDDEGKWSGYNYHISQSPFTENPSTEKGVTLSKKDSSKNNIKKEIKNKEKKFDIKEKLEKMKSDSNRHIQVIGLYWDFKNYSYKTKQQYQNALKREMRAAKTLEDYSDKRITKTMKWLRKNVNFKWTLETVFKYIDEDLNQLSSQDNDEEEVKIPDYAKD